MIGRFLGYWRAKKLATIGFVTAAVGGTVVFENAQDPDESILQKVKSSLHKEGKGNSYGLFSIVAQAKVAEQEPYITNITKDDDMFIKRRNEIMKYGYPTMDNLKQYQDHVLAYSNIHKGPLWVCEHLSDYNVSINKNVKRENSKFVPDSTINPIFRAYNSDYLNSGYDRGHLAAAANHRHTQIAMNDTFYLSNICPQTGKGLNRTKWNELEKRARTLARKHSSAHVLTGPLYLPTVIGDKKFIKYQLIGDNNVAVPTHFFKVIVAPSKNGGFILESYVMPNEEIRDDIPISSFIVPKSAIEKGAGYFIFEFIADSQYRTINGHPNTDYLN